MAWVQAETPKELDPSMLDVNNMFLDLERELADFAGSGSGSSSDSSERSSVVSFPSSARNSTLPQQQSFTPTRSANSPTNLPSQTVAAPNPEIQYLKNQLIQMEENEKKLKKQLLDSQNSVTEANSRLADQDSKIKRLVEGVKEERQLQLRNYEDERARADAADERADMAETKLLKLAEWIRTNPPASAPDPKEQSANAAKLEEFRVRAINAEEENLRLYEQVGQISVNLDQLQMRYDDEVETGRKIRNEIQLEKSKRLQMEHELNELMIGKVEVSGMQEKLKAAEKKALSAAQELQELKMKMQLQSQQLDSERDKVVRASIMNVDQRVMAADMRAEQAQIKMEEATAKCGKLLAMAKAGVDAVNLERNALQERLDASERHNQALQQELMRVQAAVRVENNNSSNSRIVELEKEVQNAKNRINALQSKLDFAETKLKTAERRAAIQTARRPEDFAGDASVPGVDQSNLSEGEFVGVGFGGGVMDELKRADFGRGLRKVTSPTQSRPSEATMRGNPAATISGDLAKQRDMRLQQLAQRPPRVRDSVKLTNVLSELQYGGNPYGM
eukprot:TRINITY_DN5501_c0_g1_i1.p1 TRINITY_DN5501_c0_g1~~TRINITY_DN5501_c0_g1_i1.p1  ORF type:complete len:563 (-),score=206.35 TRINITY_DN5501_c0_g1_i1:1028-2716(-)